MGVKLIPPHHHNLSPFTSHLYASVVQVVNENLTLLLALLLAVTIRPRNGTTNQSRSIHRFSSAADKSIFTHDRVDVYACVYGDYCVDDGVCDDETGME